MRTVRALLVCLAMVLVTGPEWAASAELPKSAEDILKSLNEPGGVKALPGADQKTKTAAAAHNALLAAVSDYKEFTPEQEYFLGRAVAAYILTKYRPYRNDKATEYVNVLGRAVSLGSEVPETFGGFHFLLLDSDDVNALSAPGGLIFLTRGLLRCCKTEDALAAVLAHEIAHVQRRHGLQAIKQARLEAALVGAAMEGVKEKSGADLSKLVQTFEEAITDIFLTMFQDGYAKKAEFEADEAAVAILRRVGYDPSGLIDALMEMEEKIVAGRQDFSKTHPSPLERYRHLQKNTQLHYAKLSPPPERQKRFLDAMGDN